MARCTLGFGLPRVDELAPPGPPDAAFGVVGVELGCPLVYPGAPKQGAKNWPQNLGAGVWFGV